MENLEPTCQSCGCILLDRDTFRSKPLCLRCRFKGATLDPDFHPVARNIYKDGYLVPLAPAEKVIEKRVVSMESVKASKAKPAKPTTFAREDWPALEKEPVHRLVRIQKKPEGVEVEGDDEIAGIALDELRDVEERLKKGTLAGSPPADIVRIELEEKKREKKRRGKK